MQSDDDPAVERAGDTKRPILPLLDRRLFVLKPEHYDRFARALSDPPVPEPRLRALLRRMPAWQK